MKKILIALIISSITFFSCKNEIDVLDDYREVMAVYGLLNPADTAHYIKVNRAFLGSENAFVMAQQYDSFNYSHDEIAAYIERWLNGTLMQTIPLVKDSTIPKDDGAFYSPGQVLYKTTVPILQDGSDYVLHARNTRSGLTVSSKTKIVSNIVVVTPKTGQSVNFYSSSIYSTKYLTAANGRMFSVTLRFHYKEIFSQDTSQKADKYVDLIFTTQKTNSLLGGQTFEQTIPAETFYRSVKSLIPVKSTVFRRFKYLEFIYSAAADEFATYIDVNQTTGATFGDKPFYTNIDGGIGLFSSRYNHYLKNIGLNSESLDSLKNGVHTKNLNFQ